MHATQGMRKNAAYTRQLKGPAEQGTLNIRGLIIMPVRGPFRPGIQARVPLPFVILLGPGGIALVHGRRTNHASAALTRLPASKSLLGHTPDSLRGQHPAGPIKGHTPNRVHAG